MKHYAIQEIGYGARRRYALVAVHENGTNPVTGGSFLTLTSALDAARDLGISVKKIGDYWQIL